MENHEGASKRKRRRWWLVIVPALLILLIVITLGFILALKMGVRHQLAAIREAGEPVTLEELNAWYPQVLDEENAALVFARAAALRKDAHDESVRLPVVGDGGWPELG